MKSKLLHDDGAGAKTYALIFDIGDEVASTLAEFVRQNRIDGAHFTAIGAFSDVTFRYFDWETKSYIDIPPIREQVEVLTLMGDVATKDGKPQAHIHGVIGKRDGTAHGGHLKEAHVRPTLELILTESPAHLRKRVDEKTGLALISV